MSLENLFERRDNVYCSNSGNEISTDAKFYLNQALVFHIFSLLCLIPFVGWLWAIFMLIYY